MRELRRFLASAVLAATAALLGACADRAGPGAPRAESDSAERAARASDFDAPVDVARLLGLRPMLWLSRGVDQHVAPIMDGARQVGTSSTPTFRLEDAIPLPTMDAGERLELLACRTPEGLNVASVGPWHDRLKTLGSVRLAWGHDLRTGRLVEVDPRTVRCRNEAVAPP